VTFFLCFIVCLSISCCTLSLPALLVPDS
jgi:hypothetical protein